MLKGSAEIIDLVLSKSGFLAPSIHLSNTPTSFSFFTDKYSFLCVSFFIIVVNVVTHSDFSFFLVGGWGACSICDIKLDTA